MVDEEEYRVLSWVHNAVICNAKKLRLDIALRTQSDFTLPHDLLGSVFLESFTLIFRDGFGFLNIPSTITTIGFCCLKTLKLRSVEINESFGNWVSSSCKFLEELVLIYIKGIKSLTITSSSLKILEIFHIYDLVHLHVSAEVLERMALIWLFSSHKDRRLQLFTPKLEIFNFLWVVDMFHLGLHPKLEIFDFVWTGDIFNFRLTEKFMCVVEGRMCPKPSSRVTAYNNLVHLLHVVDKPRGLVLYADSIQDLFMRGHLPYLLTDLLALHVLLTGSNYNLVPMLESFFKGTPNLRWLSISRKDTESHSTASEEEDGRIMGHDKLQGIPFMHNLKFVTIELVSRGKNELELIKFLLEHARNLQRLTVLYAPPLPSDVGKEITGYEKVSSVTELKFRPI
ncbi:hypothetical protein TIFTF001_024969 [Ficus carica]|uniref:FBD domain-containing protein n=1 Tax=Ficus carica TaxID=3494 RepID=A0AA88DDT7_FICCA|nr:hypothetical protein TIFTF001_024969 [Ficus carica]